MEKEEKKMAVAKVNKMLVESCCEYRLCPICGEIINEGYYYSDHEFCCSDECAAEMEGKSVDEFREEIDNAVKTGDIENYDEGYWTTVD